MLYVFRATICTRTLLEILTVLWPLHVLIVVLERSKIQKQKTKYHVDLSQPKVFGTLFISRYVSVEYCCSRTLFIGHFFNTSKCRLKLFRIRFVFKRFFENQFVLCYSYSYGLLISGFYISQKVMRFTCQFACHFYLL